MIACIFLLQSLADNAFQIAKQVRCTYTLSNATAITLKIFVCPMLAEHFNLCQANTGALFFFIFCFIRDRRGMMSKTHQFKLKRNSQASKPRERIAYEYMLDLLAIKRANMYDMPKNQHSPNNAIFSSSQWDPLFHMSTVCKSIKLNVSAPKPIIRDKFLFVHG